MNKRFFLTLALLSCVYFNTYSCSFLFCSDHTYDIDFCTSTKINFNGSVVLLNEHKYKNGIVFGMIFFSSLKVAVDEWYKDGCEKKPIFVGLKNRVQSILQDSIKDERKSDGKKKAALFDIDETAIFCSLDDVDKQVTIKPLFDIYNFLKSVNITLFFVTARNQLLEPLTVNQLKIAGYNDYEKIFFRDIGENPVLYKARIRKEIAQKYDLLIMFDDVLDNMISGGFAPKYSVWVSSPFSMENSVDIWLDFISYKQ